tara:strand:- start:1540 stop:4281 length:2742 start_codon:yes stop_codon:yes gene_type:complete
MEQLIKNKSEIKQKLGKYKKKVFDLENKLYEIELKQSKISYIDILEQLTLNDQQKQVVFSKEKHSLVIACPGSGKTHTLISKYIYLISQGEILSEETILITFTKKSGMEMGERLSKLIPLNMPSYVGSLHGFCFRILQQSNNINYTVLDERDSRSLLREVIDNDQIIDLEIKSLVRSKISLILDYAATSYPFNIKKACEYFGIKQHHKIVTMYYKEYSRKKKSMRLLDFTDLMVMFCDFLKTKKGKEYIPSIKYIFFDEYQDINSIQNYILKQFTNASLMVVGDDAQAIYKFRGSDVKYIWNFTDDIKNSKQYMLEMNYRSTGEIIDFCQNIIANNTNQFKKDVKPFNTEKGIKPKIMGFPSEKEQYLWIVNDIKEKISQGVKLKDIVILARKNYSLDRIELELVGNNINVIKSLGVSLLNRQHVKDFLAFLTIVVNNKSFIHWKRVLALHKKIGMIRANKIIDMDYPILESINHFIIENPQLRVILQPLLDFFSNLNKVKDNRKKIRFIIEYLENIWLINKNHDNIEDKVNDLNNLTSYLNNTTIYDFINDLYLNKDVDGNLDNCLFLSTVHGAKGLEYEHTYIIDFTSNTFPSVRPKFYLDEFDEMEEERRLFYVAASRTKENLIITYHYDYNPTNFITVSPFIKELEKNLYHSVDNNFVEVKKTGIVSTDVNNYLRLSGYSNIQKLYTELKYKETNLGFNFDIELKNSRYLVGNFMDYLLCKIIHVNFPSIVVKFDLPLKHKDSKFPNNIYHKYIDKLEDWRNNMDIIFFIASYRMKSKENLEFYKEVLTNSTAYNYYLKVEQKIIKFIKSMNPTKIYLHYNLTCGSIKAEADIMILGKEKNYLIEIKASKYIISTLSNVTQTMLYSFLLDKRDIKVNDVYLINLLDGSCCHLYHSNLKKITKAVKKLIY